MCAAFPSIDSLLYPPYLQESYISYPQIRYEDYSQELSKSLKNIPKTIIHLIGEYAVDELTPPDPKYKGVGYMLTEGRQFVSEIAIGKNIWGYYCGYTGKSPPLPRNIHAILAEPCPFAKCKGEKVGDTHRLILIPATLNGKAMTLRLLSQLKPRFVPSCNLKNLCQDLVERTDMDVPFEASHWILINFFCLHEKVANMYSKQQIEIQKIPNYKIPQQAQTITAFFIENLIMGKKYFRMNTLNGMCCWEKYEDIAISYSKPENTLKFLGCKDSVLIAHYNYSYYIVPENRLKDSFGQKGVTALQKLL